MVRGMSFRFFESSGICNNGNMSRTRLNYMSDSIVVVAHNHNQWIAFFTHFFFSLKFMLLNAI